MPYVSNASFELDLDDIELSNEERETLVEGFMEDNGPDVLVGYLNRNLSTAERGKFIQELLEDDDDLKLAMAKGYAREFLEDKTPDFFLMEYMARAYPGHSPSDFTFAESLISRLVRPAPTIKPAEGA